MRVGIYCHSIAPSIDGVCRRFTGILQELIKQGHEVILFTIEETPQDIPSELLDVISLDHVTIAYYPGKKISAPSLFSWLRIFRGMRKWRPDIVHVTADGLSQFFALAGCILSIPVVGSFHTDLIDLLTVLKAPAFQKWCVKTKESVDSNVLDGCATTSKSFSAKLLNQGVKCDHIINTAVDTEVFNPSMNSTKLRKEMTFGSKNAQLLVYAGRISKEKRIDIIIEAIKDLDNTYLAIVGDGPQAEEYAQLHGKENRIYCKPRFLNHDELAQVYASSDIHVSASVFETLGNTVLEAFSCGIPVVVPLTQGFMDTVHEGIDGLFFQPGSSSDAGLKIRSLLNNKSLRNGMGKAARSGVQNRTIENVVRDLLAWYDRGISLRYDRTGIVTCFIFLYLCLTVPFTIFVYNGFAILVAIFRTNDSKTTVARHPR